MADPPPDVQVYARALQEVSSRYERLVQSLSILIAMDELDQPKLTPEAVSRRIVELIASGLAAENCSLMMLDSQRECLVLRAACSPFQEEARYFGEGDPSGCLFSLGQGIVGKVAQTGELVRIADVNETNDFDRIRSSRVSVRALMCIPLRDQDRILGVLNLSHSQPDFFSADNERILSQIAQRAARILSTQELQRRVIESEAFYKLIADNAGDGILVTDGQGTVLSANQALEHIVGAPAQQLIDGMLVWEESIVEEDRPLFEEFLKGVRAGVPPQTLEYRRSDSRGEIHHLEQRSSVMADPSGRMVAQVSVIRDVTERKLAEGERARLVTAIEQAAESIVITDTSGVIQYVNAAFETVTGFSRNEVLGLNPRVLKSGEHGRSFYQQMWKTILAGQVWAGRITNRRKDGSLLREEVTISPVFDTSGETVNFVAVKKDVTHIEKLEAHLRQANKMEALGTLAGGIAHDFNNILQVILGFADLASRDVEPDSEVGETLREIVTAAIRGSELASQVLAFSRQSEQSRQPVPLPSVVNEVLKFLRGSFPSTIEVRQSTKQDAGLVLADPSQMHQVLMNLCTNAYQAMRDGGGLLEVELDELDLSSSDLPRLPDLVAGSFVRLSVRDTGVGMERGVLERIFEPYFTTRKKGEGTGLGLAMVHGIVRRHGGFITVESNPGEGTIFQVYLPRYRQRVSKDVALHAEEQECRGQERILFVDDEEQITQLATRALQRFGYQVESRTSSVEALELFRSRPEGFDLVVTDLTMANLTGIELTRRLNAIRRIPVVLCTGYSDVLDPESARLLGIVATVQKPVIFSELSRTIRRALDTAE